MGAGASVGAGAQGGFDVDLAWAWRRFEANLADHLASMPESAYVTVTSAQASPGQRGQRPYVDLVAVDADQLIAVASLPSYLYSCSPEMIAADRRLHGLGWVEPGKPAVDGTVMDYVMDGTRDEAALLATIAVATFREVWNVPHPSFLSAWTVDVGNHSSGPAALSYDRDPRGEPTEPAGIPTALRSLHAFCQLLGTPVDAATVYAVCGENDMQNLRRLARTQAKSCLVRSERSGSEPASSRVWRQQARSWIHTADSLRVATDMFRTSSGQDRSAKSAGS